MWPSARRSSSTIQNGSDTSERSPIDWVKKSGWSTDMIRSWSPGRPSRSGTGSSTAACAPSWIGCASGLQDRRANHMGISSDEISSLIKRRIKEFDVPILAADVGIVTEVGDGIAQIYGLQGAQALELLEFKGGVSGIALNLEEDSVGAVILGPYEDIKEGDQVRTTGKIIQVPVGEALVGRVVNALGEPIDGKGPIETKEFAPVEKVAPGVITRQPVDTPLQTGIKAIDAMIPIGRGQRELIIGDRQTGKTAIALDTIINQKGQGVICIYVAIGQRAATGAPAAGTGGVPRRRLLPALPAARTGGAHEQGQRWWLADGAAHHRDAGGRYLRLHPHQRDLDHRWPDLPADRSLLRGHPARYLNRSLRLARRWRCPDQGHPAGRRPLTA